MPFEDTVNSIPQSDTDRIARRLLGDDLVDRFGDVIGARPHTARDIARDFALGVAGGPTKSTELALQVQEQFQKAYTKEANAAVERATQDREQATMVISTLKTISGLPPGHRAAIFQETLDQAGIPYSKAAVKFLVDGDTLAQLPINDLMERAETGEVTTASMSAVLGSATATARWYSDMTRASTDRVATGNMVLDAEKKALGIKDMQQKMRERAATEQFRITSAREGAKGRKLQNVGKRQKLNAPGKATSPADAFKADLASMLTPAATPAPAAPPPVPSGQTPPVAPVAITPSAAAVKRITQVQ